MIVHAPFDENHFQVEFKKYLQSLYRISYLDDYLEIANLRSEKKYSFGKIFSLAEEIVIQINTLKEAKSLNTVEEYVLKLRYCLFFYFVVSKHPARNYKCYKHAFLICTANKDQFLMDLEDFLIDEVKRIFKRYYYKPGVSLSWLQANKKKEQMIEKGLKKMKKNGTNSTKMEKEKNRQIELMKKYEKKHAEKVQKENQKQIEMFRKYEQKQKEKMKKKEASSTVWGLIFGSRNEEAITQSNYRTKEKKKKEQQQQVNPSSTSTTSSSSIVQPPPPLPSKIEEEERRSEKKKEEEMKKHLSRRLGIEKNSPISSPVFNDVSEKVFESHQTSSPSPSSQQQQQQQQQQKPEMKKVFVNQRLVDEFLNYAYVHINEKIEFCGLLFGKLINGNQYFITHCVIPDQIGTENSVFCTDEMSLWRFKSKYQLVNLGWIHTHPTQHAFLSSVDIYTQFGYQCGFKEFVAIVCAPRKVPKMGIFRIKDEEMDFVETITRTDKTFGTQFKQIAKRTLFEPCLHCICSYNVEIDAEIIDMRKTKKVLVNEEQQKKEKKEGCQIQ